MGKKLAIKGHPTRGNEVIELLEMMGGEAIAAKGDDETAIYVIPVNGIIDVRYAYKKRIDNYEIFTLEEFLEKYPFKVGYKVIDLKSGKIAEVYKINWSENNSRIYYDIKYPNNHGCQRRLMDLEVYKEEAKMKNVLAELLEHIKTTPKEELEREFEEIKEWSNIGPTVEEFRTFCECVNKKPKYPDNYKECAKIMNCPIDGPSGWLFKFDANIKNTYYRKKDILMGKFIRLLICRDAYWQVVGEEMGLGKPWEPKSTEMSHAIVCRDDGDFLLHRRTRAILIFPTKEMRDAFYENFKDLIEQCKELL